MVHNESNAQMIDASIPIEVRININSMQEERDIGVNMGENWRVNLALPFLNGFIYGVWTLKNTGGVGIPPMEALKKLEKVQTMLSFMKKRDITSSSAESDRFLAEFLIFMSQPCCLLDMETKCNLIFEHLPKISTKILGEVGDSVIDEDSWAVSSMSPSNWNFDGKRFSHSPEDTQDKMVMVGIDAMRQANSTLEDFCRSYFMFHGMDVTNPQSIFNFLPILFFTESYIYQLDSINEKGLLSPTEDTNPEINLSIKTFVVSRRFQSKVQVGNQITEGFLHNLSSVDPFDDLSRLFKHGGLLTDRIVKELKSGTEYWALERKLCDAVLNKKKVFLEDALRTLHLKSFDYRVLNLLLYQLRCEQVNELHMEFLSVSELIVEIADDLFDYEDDVIKNSFNILRMFVNIYGPMAAPSMLVKYIADAEDKLKLLSEALDPDLASNYWRRCKEATAEGGKSSVHVFGTWNIPPIITDEESYRLEVVKSELAVPTRAHG